MNKNDYNFQKVAFLHRQRLAFHVAGHAAAICLNNKTRNLPPVFFQIVFTDTNNNASLVEKGAQLEGGCLIEYLSSSNNDLKQKAKKLKITPDSLVSEYNVAVQADIINSFVGSLAEAKFVAINDAEEFSRFSINSEALRNYGGNTALALLNDYFQKFYSSKREQKEISDTFLLAAYNFVDNSAHWKMITRIAHHILKNTDKTVFYDDIAFLIEHESIF